MRTKIESLLAPMNALTNRRLWNDGFVFAAIWLLEREGIDYDVWEGMVTFRGKTLPEHYWIRCGDLLIDYRLRMYFGPDAPHGVHEYPVSEVDYYGGRREAHASPTAFNIITGMDPYAEATKS